MAAAFKFKNYQVSKLIYIPRLSHDDADAKYNISITNGVSVNNEDKHMYRCELSIVVSGGAQAEVNLLGYFEATDFYTDEEYDREAKEVSPISVSILLPIARSILATLSCQDGSKPILIPVTNIDEMQPIAPLDSNPD